MIVGRYCLKRIIFDKFIIYFKKYFHSFIQSAVFTGRVARQNNGLYVLRMTVKLAYCINNREKGANLNLLYICHLAHMSKFNFSCSGNCIF